MKKKLTAILIIAFAVALCSCASRRCDCSEWSYNTTIVESNEA